MMMNNDPLLLIEEGRQKRLRLKLYYYDII